MNQSHQQIEFFREIAGFADLARREYEHSLSEILEVFKRTDPELASLVIEIWDDEKDVALFMASANTSLREVSPYQALSLGKREEVLSLIYKIEHGIFS